MTKAERDFFEAEQAMAWFVYESARIEAIASRRPIIPEPWIARDGAFIAQMTEVVGRYMTGELPTPEEAHDSWVRAYAKMGWRYGRVRDVTVKTHPDMVPFAELPKAERDKDEIFLMLVAVARRARALLAEEEKPKGDDPPTHANNPGSSEPVLGGAVARAAHTAPAQEEEKHAVATRTTETVSSLADNAPGIRGSTALNDTPVASLPVAEPKRGVEEVLHELKEEMLMHAAHIGQCDWAAKRCNEALRLYRDERVHGENRERNLKNMGNEIAARCAGVEAELSALKANVEKALRLTATYATCDVFTILGKIRRILEGRDES